MKAIKTTLWTEIMRPKDIEYGAVCAICHKPFMELYDRPLACEDCGGDGVLDEQAIEEVKSNNVQLGVDI